MYTIHATKKLRDRVKAPLHEPVAAPSTALGNWYATVLFWQPQVALFVNETHSYQFSFRSPPQGRSLTDSPSNSRRC